MIRPIPIFKFVFAAFYATSYQWEDGHQAYRGKIPGAAERKRPEAVFEAANALDAKIFETRQRFKKAPDAGGD